MIQPVLQLIQLGQRIGTGNRQQLPSGCKVSPRAEGAGHADSPVFWFFTQIARRIGAALMPAAMGMQSTAVRRLDQLPAT